ncbi:MAG: hypothetical protein V1794_16795 [Candidatus Glassbacteria bacterium]
MGIVSLTGRFNKLKPVLLLAALHLAGCSVGMRGTLPGVALDPEAVIGDLERIAGQLRTDKQIFRVHLLDKGRTFSGDGALVYSAPDTLQLSIYGPPFTTLWMQMLTRGDSITVVLPKENKVVRTTRNDPSQITEMAGSRGLTDAEFLGGVTGVFHLDLFRTAGMRLLAARDGSLTRLRLFDEDRAYEFAYDSQLDAVVQFIHYRNGKKQSEITRTDFRRIESLARAAKTVYRDYYEDREITVLVGKEEVNLKLSVEAFQILLPDGS